MRSATISIFAIAVMGVLLCSMVVKADDTAAIDDPGEPNNIGQLYDWAITADEFKQYSEFTISGKIGYGDAFGPGDLGYGWTTSSCIAIRWMGANGIIDANDPGITWWNPQKNYSAHYLDVYYGGYDVFNYTGIAKGFGKALIQISFISDDEAEQLHYVQGYVDFEAGQEPPKPKDDVVKQITDFASANLLWIAILVVLFIAIFFSKGAISIVLIVIMFAILAAWFIGWLPTWSELMEWFRGLV